MRVSLRDLLAVPAGTIDVLVDTRDGMASILGPGEIQYNRGMFDDKGRQCQLTAVADIATVIGSRWTWALNSKCKYLNLTINTETGLCVMRDRDGTETSLQQLAWQYSEENPVRP